MKKKKQFNVQRFVAIILLICMIGAFLASCMMYF